MLLRGTGTRMAEFWSPIMTKTSKQAVRFVSGVGGFRDFGL